MPSKQPSVRQVAHVETIPWQQAYDYGVITFEELTAEQQAEVQRSIGEQVARDAARELARRECLRVNGEHAWVLSFRSDTFDEVPLSIECAQCSAASPVPDDALFGEFRVRLVTVQDRGVEVVPVVG